MKKIIISLLILSLLAVLLIMAGKSKQKQSPLPSSSGPGFQMIPESNLPSPIQIITDTPTPSLLPTQVPTQTPSPTPTLAPGESRTGAAPDKPLPQKVRQYYEAMLEIQRISPTHYAGLDIEYSYQTNRIIVKYSGELSLANTQISLWQTINNFTSIPSPQFEYQKKQ